LRLKSIILAIYLHLRKAILRALGLFLLKPSEPPFQAQAVHKILFIRIDRIGDLVLSTPALRAIKEACPASHLTVLASPSNRGILDHNPRVDEVIVFRRTGGLGYWIQTMRTLRARRYDLAIDPYQDYELPTALIALMSGAGRRVGYASWGREIFFTTTVPGVKPRRHFTDIVLDVLQPLGITTENRTPEMFLSDDEVSWSLKWTKEQGLGDRPLIGIHPGAFYPSQRWPAEYFSELLQALADGGLWDVLVFGGPDDADLVAGITSRLKTRPGIFTGNDLRGFSALLSRCSLLVCNNSGPLHMAVALGIPSISFMGPTDRDRWMPLGDRHRVLRVNELDCIGCNLGYCRIKTHDCMRRIKPVTVLEHIRAVGTARP